VCDSRRTRKVLPRTHRVSGRARQKSQHRREDRQQADRRGAWPRSHHECRGGGPALDARKGTVRPSPVWTSYGEEKRAVRAVSSHSAAMLDPATAAHTPPEMDRIATTMPRHRPTEPKRRPSSERSIHGGRGTAKRHMTAAERIRSAPVVISETRPIVQRGQRPRTTGRAPWVRRHARGFSPPRPPRCPSWQRTGRVPVRAHRRCARAAAEYRNNARRNTRGPVGMRAKKSPDHCGTCG